jgi:hypothetical protein
MKKGKVYAFDLPNLEIKTYKKLYLFNDLMRESKQFYKKYDLWCPTEIGLYMVNFCNRVFGSNYNYSNSSIALNFLKFVSNKYQSGEYKPVINIKEDK